MYSSHSQLAEAYRKTHYLVDDLELIIRIEQHHPQLDDFLQAHQFKTWAYITASNPASHLLSPAENQVLQNRLLAQIKAQSYAYANGRGLDPSGQWPAEESFLICNISLPAARALSQRFGQLAFLFGTLHAKAELIWV